MSGLPFQVEVITKGTGTQRPNKGDAIEAHYDGMFPDGRPFDSSRKRGKPFKFNVGVGNVIKGWDMVMLTMVEGDRVKITLPPEYAYGSTGAGGVIPPNATLVFDMELLKIIPKK